MLALLITAATGPLSAQSMEAIRRGGVQHRHRSHVSGRPKVRPSGFLTVRSMRVAGTAAEGSRLFFGPEGAGFAIGTDGTERFLIEDTSSRSGPLLSLSKGVLRLGAHKVEARSVSTEGGVTVHGVGQWRLVVAEDFAEQGLGWSRADVTRCGGVTMLGGYCKFSKGEVNKTFSGIAPHTQLRVVATYHFIDRWIGEAGYLKLNIGQDRAPVVVWSEQHSQEKSENGLSLCGQQETPEGKFSATIDVTLAHREDSVQLTFGSTMKDSDPCDESWGVSGVELYTRG